MVIIPDGTRTAPIPLVFRQICDLLLERVAALDFLVALGTHAPMTESALLAHVGISRIERAGKYCAGRTLSITLGMIRQRL